MKLLDGGPEGTVIVGDSIKMKSTTVAYAKPITVKAISGSFQAIQWDGDNRVEVANFIGAYGLVLGSEVRVDTSNGEKSIRKNGWILCRDAGMGIFEVYTNEEFVIRFTPVRTEAHTVWDDLCTDSAEAAICKLKSNLTSLVQITLSNIRHGADAKPMQHYISPEMYAHVYQGKIDKLTVEDLLSVLVRCGKKFTFDISDHIVQEDSTVPTKDFLTRLSQAALFKIANASDLERIKALVEPATYEAGVQGKLSPQVVENLGRSIAHKLKD